MYLPDRIQAVAYTDCLFLYLSHTQRSETMHTVLNVKRIQITPIKTGDMTTGWTSHDGETKITGFY